jgi:iron-regulated transporter 1
MLSPWREYASSPIFLASFSLSLLYLTVLSFAPQMITYLLHAGFTPLQVSCMRIAAVISEICGTIVAPAAMRRVGPVRAGLWFINWQFGSLAAAAAAFLLFDDEAKSKLVAVCLVVGVTLSRLGLWGFDLNVQYLVQEVPPPFFLPFKKKS